MIIIHFVEILLYFYPLLKYRHPKLADIILTIILTNNTSPNSSSLITNETTRLFVDANTGLTSSDRFWKKVFVKLTDNSCLQLFNSKEDKDPFQELPLQACYSVSDIGQFRHSCSFTPCNHLNCFSLSNEINYHFTDMKLCKPMDIRWINNFIE